MNDIEKSQYPIGKFRFDPDVTASKREQWITEYAEVPSELDSAVADLTDEQLDTRYRSGGWTVRQVVHHLADGHLNACGLNWC